MSRLDEIAESLGEFAHQQYLGCVQNEKAKDGFEYGYENEVVNIAHQYFENEGKREIKALFLEIIGEDAKGVELVDPIDYGNDEYYDSGYNAALAEQRKKVEAL